MTSSLVGSEMCIRDRSKNNSDMQEEHGIEHTLSSMLGALMRIAFRTRPDICWAVTRVSRAVKRGEFEHEIDEKARIQIKHIL
eukprot:11724923-Prorocentrum_lima.AAC.1